MFKNQSKILIDELLDGSYLSIFIQLSPHVPQLQLNSALCLLQLCCQLLLKIQPQLFTALGREICLGEHRGAKDVLSVLPKPL